MTFHFSEMVAQMINAVCVLIECLTLSIPGQFQKVIYEICSDLKRPQHAHFLDLKVEIWTHFPKDYLG